MQRQDIVNAIQAAVSEVFSTMLGIEVQACPIQQDANGPRTAEGVMSFVGLSGNWVGSGLITCSSSFACRLCSSFLMTESTRVDGDVLDAVGEIANIIIGSFKTIAESAVGPLTLSIPTTIYGKSFMSKSLGSTEWTVLPFRNGDDVVEVWVCFKPASDSHAHRHDAIQLQAV